LFNNPKATARIMAELCNAGLWHDRLALPIPQWKGPAMRDTFAILETIRRPRLLMQAARHGLAAYRRNRDLRRLIGAETSPLQAITQLIAEEGRAERTRLSGEADYSASRHIELLAALIAEASRLPRLVS
jgi:hypothetical protein